MMELTTIMVIGSVILYLLTIIFSKRGRELPWLSLIVSVCAIASIIIDETLDGDTLALLMVPEAFVFLMSGAKAMNLFERW